MALSAVVPQAPHDPLVKTNFLLLCTVLFTIKVLIN